MKTEATKQHQWLQRLVGEWTFHGGSMSESSEAQGIEVVRSVGDLWIVAEGKTGMPDGTEATTVMTLGYDPGKDRFVGTWIGSMMTHLWIYSGTLDPSGNLLTLESEGPGHPPGAPMTKFRDIVQFRSDDHRVLSAQMLGDDGRWQSLMSADYTRKGRTA